MTSTETVSEAMATGTPVDRLPAPFVADQGALCLPEGPSAATAVEPRDLVAVIVAAAAHALHVGKVTLATMQAVAPTLRHLSAKRRGDLLLELVMAPDPARAVDLAVRSGVLRQFLPDIDGMRAMPRGHGLFKDVYTHTLRVLAATPSDPITRLAALLHDIAKPDTLVVEGGVAHFPNHDLLGADRAGQRLRRLGFDQTVVNAVATLVRLHLRANSYEAQWTDSAVRRLHLDAGDQWERLLDLSYADVTSARPDVVARARRRVHDLAEHARALDVPVEVSPLDGNALMAHFGRGPGRWIGEVKRQLIACVRAGKLQPDDVAAAWSIAERFVAGDGGG